MGNSLLGNVIYFWIFIIGGVFVAHLFGLPLQGRSMILFLVVLTLVYWGLAFLRYARQRRRDNREE
ncbi:MAG: hypothetical protein ACOX41_04370 [Anaerovoracaceae bacterium]|jgi:hypothetical protein